MSSPLTVAISSHAAMRGTKLTASTRIQSLPGEKEPNMPSERLRYSPSARAADTTKAGLGVGTLYRHFPTRDALIEAVYRAEVEALAKAATRLSDAHAPLEALRAWMRLFVDYIATKNLIAPALNSMVGGPSQLFAASGQQVKAAIRALVGRAVASGDIRPDLDPLDLLRALVGVANVATSPDWEASAKRLVDILIAGSRPTA